VLLWFFGHHAMAIVLLIWSVVFVVAGEQVAKPFILRKILHSDQPMHAGLISLSLLGGISMFGLIGLVLGPLAIAFFLAMVRIYERDFAPRVQS
jgi:predicted PurR-regulated permease PerM